jgi:hypothetical protein
MTNPITKYEEQCVTCNLPHDMSKSVHSWRGEDATPYTVLAKYITDNHEKISADAVSNHFRKHCAPSPVGISRTPTTTVAPLLGVVKPPKGWEAQATIVGDEGEIVSPAQNKPDLKDFSDILRFFKIDPEAFEVLNETIQVRQWQAYGGDWQSYYKFNIRKKSPDAFDLPTLFAEVKSYSDRIGVRDRSLWINGISPLETPRQSNRTLVVPFSDLQAGKVGSRGDSKALVERVLEKKEKLAGYIAQQNCSEAVFLDGGDVVESFENTAQQGFTNDLSIMQQLDLAGTLEQEFITLLAETHDKVIVGGVPSNHGAWRKGKDVLGRPSDDWGLFLLKQIQKAYKLAPEAYGHVEFQFPGEWEKGLCIPVQGLDIGLVHGEDSSLAQMENWWAKQVHGNSPIAAADILITAHYHTLGLKPSGRSRKTGKQKYWIATPTLDNGSDWWANKSGSDSDPGLMAFVIDSEIGFDLQSFTVL